MKNNLIIVAVIFATAIVTLLSVIVWQNSQLLGYQHGILMETAGAATSAVGR